MLIRTMTEDDLDFAVEMTSAESWLSETRASFETFLAHDPNGGFIGEISGQRIGMCVATGYDHYGFLGELIIRPEHRNRGLGAQLLKHAMSYLTAKGCKSQLLDGDLPAVPLYERLGFRTVCRSLRFLGRVEPASDNSIRPMTTNDFEAVAALDRAAFGDNRRVFLEQRLSRYPQFCFVLIQDERIKGYIMAWPGNGVVTIGPWVAAVDVDKPEALLSALATSVGDTKIRLGVLETNQRAVRIISGVAGLGEQTESVRMAIGPRSDLGQSVESLAVGSPATG